MSQKMTMQAEVCIAREREIPKTTEYRCQTEFQGCGMKNASSFPTRQPKDGAQEHGRQL
jgi:hypothetical protein